MFSRWWILLLALLAFGIRFHNLTQVLLGGHLYFVDADCYSRMTRVQMVSRAPGTVVHYQQFENWPEGVVSHATAPLDYLIVGIERVIRPIWPQHGPFASLANQTLDVAGALVSPLLGVLLCVCVAFWAQGLRCTNGEHLACWWMVPLLLALSPALVHATVFGRPDHQSLLVFTLGIAIALEFQMQLNPRRLWAMIGGVMWGLALWVSLFEPLILLAAGSLLGILFAPGSWKTRSRLEWGGGLLVVLVLAYMVEGLPYALPDFKFREAFVRWGASIGELHSLGELETLGHWLGALIWVAPVALWVCVRRQIGGGQGWVKWISCLLMLTLALSCWQVRWSPYLGLVFAFSAPWILSVCRRPWQGALAGVLAFWPIASDWEQRWYPEAERAAEKYLDRSEQLNARLTAERMREVDVLPFIAPWWLSPSIAYWSGQPAVAGSGHEGISGILDSARFFLTTKPSEAREILERRGVCLVVASDSARAVQNAAEVLGVPVPHKPLAERLWEPELEAAWGLVGEKNVTTFRLLRVLPGKADGTPAASSPK